MRRWKESYYFARIKSAVDVIEENIGVRESARRHDLSPQVVAYWCRKVRHNTNPKCWGGSRGTKYPEAVKAHLMDFIWKFVRQKPLSSMRIIQTTVEQNLGLFILSVFLPIFKTINSVYYNPA